jgi:hypothetical protein
MATNSTKKYFYNPSYNKAIFCESSSILPNSYWFSSKEDIFNIIFSFWQNKSEINKQ